MVGTCSVPYREWGETGSVDLCLATSDTLRVCDRFECLVATGEGSMRERFLLTAAVLEMLTDRV